jgi:pimeloyl-ACP methyl ester carboxylesterase
MSPEEAIRALYHDPKIVETLLALPVTPEMVDMQLKNRHTTARLAWEPRFHDPHLPKWLHRIDVPVKIVWGEQDGIIPVKFVDEYRKHFPKAQIHVVKSCGHLPPVEKPDEFVAIVCR